MTDRNSIIPAVYLFLIREENHVLLQRRYKTGYEDGRYGLPSGHIDFREMQTDAALREAKEELGITIRNNDLKIVHTAFRKVPKEHRDRVDVFFQVLMWDGDPKNMEPEKCDDLSWFPIETLPDNTINYVRDIIGKTINGMTYSEIES